MHDVLTAVMLRASSYWPIRTLMTAEASNSAIIGSLNCPKYFCHIGSSSSSRNSFVPTNLRRDTASSLLSPVETSTCSCLCRSSTLLLAAHSDVTQAGIFSSTLSASQPESTHTENLQDTRRKILKADLLASSTVNVSNVGGSRKQVPLQLFKKTNTQSLIGQAHLVLLLWSYCGGAGMEVSGRSCYGMSRQRKTWVIQRAWENVIQSCNFDFDFWQKTQNNQTFQLVLGAAMRHISGAARCTCRCRPSAFTFLDRSKLQANAQYNNNKKKRGRIDRLRTKRHIFHHGNWLDNEENVSIKSTWLYSWSYAGSFKTRLQSHLHLLLSHDS